jgi:hypothetical protein
MGYAAACVVSICLTAAALWARQSQGFLAATARHEFSFWRRFRRDPGYLRYGEEDAASSAKTILTFSAILFGLAAVLSLVSMIRMGLAK